MLHITGAVFVLSMNLPPSSEISSNVTEIEIISAGDGLPTQNSTAENHLSNSQLTSSSLSTPLEAVPTEIHSDRAALKNQKTQIHATPNKHSNSPAAAAAAATTATVATAGSTIAATSLNDDLDQSLNLAQSQAAESKESALQVFDGESDLLVSKDLAALNEAKKNNEAEKSKLAKQKSERLKKEQQIKAQNAAALSAAALAALDENDQIINRESQNIESWAQQENQKIALEKQTPNATNVSDQKLISEDGNETNNPQDGSLPERNHLIGKGLGINPNGPTNIKSASIRRMQDLRSLPDNKIPYYDEDDRFNKREGEVVFEAYVTPQGQTTDFRLIQSSGYRSLDLKSLAAFKKWRFFPGQQGRVEMAYNWSLKGDAKERPTLLRRR